MFDPLLLVLVLLLGIVLVLLGEIEMREQPFCTILCVVLLVEGCKFPLFDDYLSMWAMN